jgi:hypothetical protein
MVFSQRQQPHQLTKVLLRKKDTVSVLVVTREGWIKRLGREQLLMTLQLL